MKTVKGSEFKVISDFLLQNHEKAYKSPKKMKNSKEKKEMEKLFEAGKTSNRIFNDKLCLLATNNNLFEVKNKNFLDGSFSKIRNYYWGQLKSEEYYRYPESIAIFCEVVDNKQIQFRVSLEIDENHAQKEDIGDFLKVLDKPLNRDLCYMGSVKFNHSLKILSINKKEIKEKLASGQYNKIQVTYLVKNSETDQDIFKELDKGIKLLLPYYKFIMN